jgi:hypothetical protein
LTDRSGYPFAGLKNNHNRDVSMFAQVGAIASASSRLRIPTVLFFVLICALLGACASHPKVAVAKPLIHSIAIIPATNPTWYSFENAAPPIGYPFQYWVNKVDSKNKAKAFNDKLNEPPLNLGTAVTQEVAAALQSRGFKVEILEDIKRPAAEPDNVDYDKITTHADAILHLWIDEVGLYSAHTSTNYIPRVNIFARLFVKGQEDNVYDNNLYYGVDAKKGKEWAIVPEAKFAYPSFGAVMANIDSVRLAFDTGAQEISLKISEQIYDSTNYLRQPGVAE